MKFFTLSAALICAQLVAAGSPGGAGAEDGAIVDAIMHQAPARDCLRQALTSQEALNTFVAERAVVILDNLNNSGRFRCHRPDEEPVEVGTPSILWTTTLAPEEHHVSTPVILIANRHIAPSTALLQLYSQGGVINSSIAKSLVTSMILLEIMGDANFDGIFKGSAFHLPNTKSFGMVDTGYGTPSSVGLFGNIPNVNLYRLIHPRGLAQNLDILCIGENSDGAHLYLGFGEFFSTPKTETAILAFLYQQLVAPAEHSDVRSRYLDSIRDMYTTNDYWNQARNRLQDHHQVYMFDIETIRRFLYSSQQSYTQVVEAKDEAIGSNPELALLVKHALRIQGLV